MTKSYIAPADVEAWGDARERQGYWRGFVHAVVVNLTALAIIFVLVDHWRAHADEVSQQQLAWPQLKQSDLPQECQLYPNAPCLVPTGKETEQEREQRQYKERQLRLQMDNAKKVPKP